MRWGRRRVKLCAMSKQSDKKVNDEPGFEQALAELEELIDKIESGQIGLEECLTHYERGMKLIGRCKGVLDQAQTRIAKLNVNADGSLAAPAGQNPDEADSYGDDDNDDSNAGRADSQPY